MLLRARSSTFLAFALTLSTIGCEDDSGSAPDAGPLPSDQCTGAADLGHLADLAAATDAGLPDSGIPDGGFLDGGPFPPILLIALGDAVDMCTTGPCLSSVLNEDALRECIDTCLATTPAGGLSVGCRDCNIEAIRCTTANCATQCLGSDRTMCEACATVNCVPRLVECTGLTPPTAP